MKFDEKKTLLILILTIGMPTLVWARQSPVPKTLSFKEALRIAEESEIQLILSRERVAQALSRIGQSRSQLWPQLNLTASQRRQTRDLRSSGLNLPGDPLVGPFNTFDARPQLVQTIFDPTVIARLKAAQAGGQLSTTQLRKTKEDVLAFVAVMYIDARRLSQKVAYVKTLLDREEKSLDVAESRFKDGIGSELQVQQSKVQYDTTMRLLHQATADAYDSRLDLLAALGFDLADPVELTQDDDFILPDLPNDISPEQLEQLPDVQVAKQQLGVSKYNHASERFEYFPKISAMADYGLSGVNPSDSNETYMFGIQASIPIFDGGLRHARIQEAESQVKSSEATLKDTTQQAQVNVIKARESFDQAQWLVQENISRRKVARQQLTLIQQGLKDGTSSDMELLDAIAQDAQAQDEEAEARAVLLTAKINWIHALGGMGNILKE